MKSIWTLTFFAIGVFSLNFLPELPQSWVFIPGGLLISAAGFRSRQWWMIALVVGMVFGWFQAKSFQSSLLPESLNNRTLVLTGEVTSNPQRQGRSLKFDFLIESADLIEGGLVEERAVEEAKATKGSSANGNKDANKADTNLIEISGTHSFERTQPVHWMPGKTRLSFYGQEDLVVGERLTLRAKLKRPHGLMNPGLFDYQQWLVGKGYGATGYVREIDERHEYSDGAWTAVHRWRAHLVNKLREAGLPHWQIQAALLVGDRSDVESNHMDLFVRTGTIHLMVISGLHIGFIAGLGYFLGLTLGRCLSMVTGINAVYLASATSMLLATAYGVAAGLSMPTQRALIMLAALLLPRLILLRTFNWWGLSLALAVVAAVDPRAVLTTGFWLSYAAVVLIFISMRPGSRQDSHEGDGVARGNDFVRGPVLALLKIQCIFLIGFSGWVLLFQGQVQVQSLPANLVAVPLTGLLIVPMEFFGLLLHEIHPSWGNALWSWAGGLIDFQIWYLQWLDSNIDLGIVRPWASSSGSSAVTSWVGVLLAVAAMVVVSNLKLAWRFAALAIVMLIFWFKPNSPYALEIRVFDVGQGLAVLVRQPGYTLLYDTGPRFSGNFDAGADIILPSLRHLEISRLDDLVISHPDEDHIGGMSAVLDGIQVERLWIGRKARFPVPRSSQPCLAGKQWTVNGVVFHFLHPFELDHPEGHIDRRSDNDRSCVLLIEFGGQRVLLPGDISTQAEVDIVRKSNLPGPFTLVVAPHHGSKSSSSPLFVSRTQPQFLVFSSGYLNRFGHPHAQVQARYLRQGAQTLGTAELGMIRFLWRTQTEKPEIIVESSRRRFWWQQ